MTDFNRDKIMQQWDIWRQKIADGDNTSAPRDWFESVIDLAYEVGAAAQRKKDAKIAQNSKDSETSLNDLEKIIAVDVNMKCEEIADAIRNQDKEHAPQ